jgi:CBS domain-containing protein
MKINDILAGKGNIVYTVTEDELLSNVLKMLVNQRIGVVLVLDSEGKLSGILSERDIIRASYQHPDSYLNSPAKEFMTMNVLIAEPEDNIDYAENIMTNNHCRHLPIIKDQKLVGLISIGDIVKAQLTESREENKYMKDYISGNA